MTKNEMLYKCAELCLEKIEKDLKESDVTGENTVKLIDEFLVVLDEIKE